MKQIPGVALAVIAALSLPVAMAQDGDFSKSGIKISKVAGSVSVIEGPVSNVAVSAGPDGMVVVDDSITAMAPLYRGALQSISTKPIRFVINTHDHADHTGGNIQFQKEAVIIAHEGVRARLEKGGPSGTGGVLKFDTPPGPKESLPVLTFDQSVTVHLNGEDIRVQHFPSAHTIGDSMVFFPKANVVETGDIFTNGAFPFIDILGGGSVDGVIAACEKLITLVPANVKVIPGHGPVSTLDDVRGYIAMIKATRAAVVKQIKAGKTPEQMKADKILDQWKNLSGQFVDTNSFIDILYYDSTKKKG